MKLLPLLLLFLITGVSSQWLGRPNPNPRIRNNRRPPPPPRPRGPLPFLSPYPMPPPISNVTSTVATEPTQTSPNVHQNVTNPNNPNPDYNSVFSERMIELLKKLGEMSDNTTTPGTAIDSNTEAPTAPTPTLANNVPSPGVINPNQEPVHPSLRKNGPVPFQNRPIERLSQPRPTLWGNFQSMFSRKKPLPPTPLRIQAPTAMKSLLKPLPTPTSIPIRRFDENTEEEETTKARPTEQGPAEARSPLFANSRSLLDEAEDQPKIEERSYNPSTKENTLSVLAKLSPKKPIVLFMRQEGILETQWAGADPGKVVKKYAGSTKIQFFNGTLPEDSVPPVFLAPEDTTPPRGYGKMPIPKVGGKSSELPIPKPTYLPVEEQIKLLMQQREKLRLQQYRKYMDSVESHSKLSSSYNVNSHTDAFKVLQVEGGKNSPDFYDKVKNSLPQGSIVESIMPYNPYEKNVNKNPVSNVPGHNGNTNAYRKPSDPLPVPVRFQPSVRPQPPPRPELLHRPLPPPSLHPALNVEKPVTSLSSQGIEIELPPSRNDGLISDVELQKIVGSLIGGDASVATKDITGLNPPGPVKENNPHFGGPIHVNGGKPNEIPKGPPKSAPGPGHRVPNPEEEDKFKFNLNFFLGGKGKRPQPGGLQKFLLGKKPLFGQKGIFGGFAQPDTKEGQAGSQHGPSNGKPGQEGTHYEKPNGQSGKPVGPPNGHDGNHYGPPKGHHGHPHEHNNGHNVPSHIQFNGHPPNGYSQQQNNQQNGHNGPHGNPGSQYGSPAGQLGQHHGSPHGQPGPQHGPSHGQQGSQHGPTHGQLGPPHGPSHGQQGPQHGPSHGQQGPQQGSTHGQPGPQHGPSHGQQGPQYGPSHGQQGPQHGPTHGQQGPQHGPSHGQQGPQHGQQGPQHGPSHGQQGPPNGRPGPPYGPLNGQPAPPNIPLNGQPGPPYGPPTGHFMSPNSHPGQHVGPPHGHPGEHFGQSHQHPHGIYAPQHGPPRQFHNGQNPNNGNHKDQQYSHPEHHGPPKDFPAEPPTKTSINVFSYESGDPRAPSDTIEKAKTISSNEYLHESSSGRHKKPSKYGKSKYSKEYFSSEENSTEKKSEGSKKGTTIIINSNKAKGKNSNKPTVIITSNEGDMSNVGKIIESLGMTHDDEERQHSHSQQATVALHAQQNEAPKQQIVVTHVQQPATPQTATMEFTFDQVAQLFQQPQQQQPQQILIQQAPQPQILIQSAQPQQQSYVIQSAQQPQQILIQQASSPAQPPQQYFIQQAQPQQQQQYIIQQAPEPQQQQQQYIIHQAPEPKQQQQYVIHQSPEPKQQQQYIIHQSPEPKQQQQYVIHQSSEPKQQQQYVIHQSPEPKQQQQYVIHQSAEPKQQQQYIIQEAGPSQQQQVITAQAAPPSAQAPVPSPIVVPNASPDSHLPRVIFVPNPPTSLPNQTPPPLIYNTLPPQHVTEPTAHEMIPVMAQSPPPSAVELAIQKQHEAAVAHVRSEHANARQEFHAPEMVSIVGQHLAPNMHPMHPSNGAHANPTPAPHHYVTTQHYVMSSTGAAQPTQPPMYHAHTPTTPSPLHYSTPSVTTTYYQHSTPQTMVHYEVAHAQTAAPRAVQYEHTTPATHYSYPTATPSPLHYSQAPTAALQPVHYAHAPTAQPVHYPPHAPTAAAPQPLHYAHAPAPDSQMVQYHHAQGQTFGSQMLHYQHAHPPGSIPQGMPQEEVSQSIERMDAPQVSMSVQSFSTMKQSHNEEERVLEKVRTEEKIIWRELTGTGNEPSRLVPIKITTQEKSFTNPDGRSEVESTVLNTEIAQELVGHQPMDATMFMKRTGQIDSTSNSDNLYNHNNNKEESKSSSYRDNVHNSQRPDSAFVDLLKTKAEMVKMEHELHPTRVSFGQQPGFKMSSQKSSEESSSSAERVISLDDLENIAMTYLKFNYDVINAVTEGPDVPGDQPMASEESARSDAEETDQELDSGLYAGSSVGSSFGIGQILAVVNELEETMPIATLSFEKLLRGSSEYLTEMYQLILATMNRGTEFFSETTIFTNEKLNQTAFLEPLNTTVIPVDFRSETASSRINAEIKRQIGDSLEENYIPSEMKLSASTKAMLVHTLVLKDKWPMPWKSIGKRSFGEYEQVEMMEITGHYPYLESDKAIEVSLPIKDDNSRVLSLILPRNIEDALNGDLGSAKNGTAPLVKVQMPMFSFTFRVPHEGGIGRHNCQAEKKSNFLNLLDDLTYASFNTEGIAAFAVTAAQINNVPEYKSEVKKITSARKATTSTTESPEDSEMGNTTEIPMTPEERGREAKADEIKTITFDRPFTWTVIDDNIFSIPLLSGAVESFPRKIDLSQSQRGRRNNIFGLDTTLRYLDCL
ncbi:unnamed protein product [Allacma fusca]|uniref:Uncharacterized protein n=1 Tax=Allacma fusca TaxID=39272 RepID=A0A8J2JE85_9HEXA|nr:unnamed protein product [Allacma fusca]